MIEIDIQRNAGEPPPARTEAPFHRSHAGMRIGKAVHRAMIIEPGTHGLRQRRRVDSAGEIAEQVADGGFQCRLGEHQVREMVHAHYYKSLLPVGAIG